MRKTVVEQIIQKQTKNKNIVVLTGDVGHSTLADKFSHVFPERYFNLGIAEANIIGVSAGLTSANLTPVIFLFSKHLLLRSLEQINDSLLMNGKKAILIGEYAGYSSTFEGETHQLLNDISILSSFPNINIYNPYDSKSMESAIDSAFLSNKSSYIRVSKMETPKKTVNRVLRKDTKNLLISTGFLGALIAESYETNDNINSCVDLILLNQIKPMNWELFDFLVLKYKNIFVIEENTQIGGLGAQIRDHYYLNKSDTNILSFGIGNHFGGTGEYEYLLKRDGLDPCSVFSKIEIYLEGKR
ncbi:serine hydroxymethyltransferase [Enterococcus faecium]|nr:serine hydroxymethyltransferase [Enterococcus faecium]